MAFTCMALPGDSTVTAPAPLLAAAIADNRAAPVALGPPEKTPTWPRLYLCASTAGTGNRLEPERRLVFERPRRNLRDDVVANADIGDHDLAASLAARQQQMPRFLAREGNGDVGAKCRAENVAAVTGNA